MNNKLEARVARLERLIKNEAVRGVPANKIPEYIIKSYSERLKRYFDRNIASHLEDIDYLDRARVNFTQAMSTVMTNTIYGDNLKDGPDGAICMKLFRDLAENESPKTVFLKDLYNEYIGKIDAMIAAAKSKLPAPYELASEVEDWFEEHMAPTLYDDEKEWLKDLRNMSKGITDSSTMDDCIDEIGAPDSDYDDIIGVLAKLAKAAIAEHRDNKRSGYDGVGSWRIDHF